MVTLHISIWPLRPGIGPDGNPLPDEETTWLDAEQKHLQNEAPYKEIQATKSQTLAYGITDFPASLHHGTTANQHLDLLRDWYH
jgi:hypothetical protein